MIYRQVLSHTTVNIFQRSSFNCEPICILPDNDPFYILIRIIKEVVSYLNTSTFSRHMPSQGWHMTRILTLQLY